MVDFGLINDYITEFANNALRWIYLIEDSIYSIVGHIPGYITVYYLYAFCMVENYLYPPIILVNILFIYVLVRLFRKDRKVLFLNT